MLEDVIKGNPMLFMCADQVEAAWQTRLLVDFPNCIPGLLRPEDAEALIAMDEYHWVSAAD